MASTIKFKTKKEAETRLKLIKQTNKNAKIITIEGHTLNKGFVIIF